MTSNDYIKRVRSSVVERDAVITELYQNTQLRNGVIGTLIKMGCSQGSAADYFTDSIVAFIKSCYKSSFSISSNLQNYLIGTAKYIWYKELARDKKFVDHIEGAEASTEETIEDNLIARDRKEALDILVQQLDDTCKKVLVLWSLNKKMKEIAKELDYKSDGMARKKKHLCLQKLYSIVAQNPEIKENLRQS